MMRFPFGETVTRLRATAQVDPYSGEPGPINWDSPDELSLPGVAFAPSGSTEVAVGGALVQVSDSAAIYCLEVDVDVKSGDRIRRDATGIEYDVAGRPALWRGAFFGVARGLVISLEEL